VAQTPQWTRTGVLSIHDNALLGALQNCSQHWGFCSAAVQGDQLLMVTLAKFSKARAPPLLPCPEVAHRLRTLVGNTRSILIANQDTSNETLYANLEATGILAEFFRWVTLPVSEDTLILYYCTMLDEIAQCSSLVKRKCCTGTPTGDVLHSLVVNNQRRNSGQAEIMQRLSSLHKMATMVQKKPEGGRQVERCFFCYRSELELDFGQKLRKCSRCQHPSYCSKECQTTDWKTHKLLCKPTSDAERKEAKKKGQNLQQMVVSFMDDLSNCYSISKEMVRFLRQGIHPNELLVELSFCPEKGMAAPALRDQPVFKVAQTRHYLEGSRPEEPDWFGKGQPCYRGCLNPVLIDLKNTYQKQSDGICLIFARAPTQSMRLFQIQSIDPVRGVQKWSKQAMEAFDSL